MTMEWLCDSPHLRGPMTREDLRIIVGLGNMEAVKPHSCEECAHYSPAFTSYEYPDDYDPPSCSVREANANLKTFPFKHAPQRCFELHFWCSAYCHVVVECDEQGDHLTHPAWSMWQATDANGAVRLNARNEKRVAEALARFLAQRPKGEAA